MNFVAIGVNHKTAPIEIREQFYLNPLQQDLFLTELKTKPWVLEAFVLSTCNRTEIYLHILENTNFEWDEIVRFILHIKKSTFHPELKKHFYFYTNHQALEHLMKVVTGLDSLVIGEKQILGQVKEAFARAQEKGLFQKHFNILSAVTIRAGKKAQNETQINAGGSSVSWAAITMAEKILGDLKEKTLLLIGAGEMSKLALEQINHKNYKKLFLMNRTKETAQLLVDKYGGESVGFSDIKEILAQSDICLCCTDAPHYVLDFEIVEKVQQLNPNKKLLLMDISMPRNIDPRVAQVPGVLLLDIDGLQNVVEENMKRRFQSVQDVENIIREKIMDFYSKLERPQKSDLILEAN